ncbi:unnamed protein product [Leptidea sinapis]|uniref:Kazal-like domain-containing protein n=1 Tax=Leptidea sinapis TaxID=189913 RepID=A0A5E4QBJ7_9NEOP|nr:unnamed protein product [Leptidea sinapis]
MIKYTPVNFFLVCLYIPYPSRPHFVWPLHWCLLADICNHTWIPECGEEPDNPSPYQRRLFIDECDMYEYNCDERRDFEPINYSDCFNLPASQCPPIPACPSHPPCPDHRFHRAGDRYISVPYRRFGLQRTTKEMSLPKNMLSGKRRYTPKRRRHLHKHTTATTINKPKTKVTLSTVILKKQEFYKNGKRMLKIVKGVFKKITRKMLSADSEFLE